MAARVDGGGTCGGRPCWKPAGRQPVKGFDYRDTTLSQAGVKTIQLRGGRPGSDRVGVSGAGDALPLPAPASGSRDFRHEGDVVIQLVGDTGGCWEATFAPTDVKQNLPDRYRAAIGL